MIAYFIFWDGICYEKFCHLLRTFLIRVWRGKVVHNLSSILFVSLCGILSGCENWFDIRTYCEVKKDWLSNYVDLSNGVPSEWTFRRVFTLLDPDKIEFLLRTHAASIVKDTEKISDQIAIDGKALRGSKQQDLGCLYSVSAWCDENNLVLSEQIVEEKSNEIKAIPLLLENLSLKDATVSIDAAGCQKSIAQIIFQQKRGLCFWPKKEPPKVLSSGSRSY